MPFVPSLAARVAREYDARDPRLDEVRDSTIALRRLLERHLDEEEDALFPAIRSGRAPDMDELRASRREHREIGAALDRLRTLTDGYRAPSWACACYRTLLEWLHALETHLMREVHLEDHVLLGRAPRSTAEAE
ncbi:MAG TPA: hemerythrin domain-containing protein [Polyangia bacterium]